MTFYVYAFEDKGTKAYSQPILRPETPKDFVELVARQIAKNPNDPTRDNHTWLLGIYDDTKGEMIPGKEHLCENAVFIPAKSKEASTDGN